MSKVDELKKKYPNITLPTFKKFEDADKTNTKKYLPFMLELWVNRNYDIKNTSDVVNIVKMFDDLLPYIKNKDIYHKDYKNIEFFLKVINDAIDTKDEKTFIREEHIDIIYESDEYIFLLPKTHIGSCKYGANTKWCTASKKDESTFYRHKKDGFLAYLISKSKDKDENFQKIAFYSKKRHDPFFDSIETYNVLDNVVNIEQIVNSGWDVTEMFTIVSMFRTNFLNWKRVQKAKEEIKSTIDLLSNVDFNSLSKYIKIVESEDNNDYIVDIRDKINNFIKKIPVKI